MSKSHRSYKKDPEDQEDISDGVGSFCPNRSIEKAFSYVTEQMCFRNNLIKYDYQCIKVKTCYRI